MGLEWKAGDWCVFDLGIGQIKKIDDDGYASFSDACCETSGKLVDRFRPLTLRNKAIVERFDYYYQQLRRIDGEAGFNYPEISQYFAQLARDAIDGEDHPKMFDKGPAFVTAAREYTPVIDGVPLFRRKLSAAW